MHLEILSVIAQAVGSIAVFISIIYLAKQFQQNTKIAEVNANESASTAMRDITQSIIEDKELTILFKTGLEHLDRLNEVEKTRFIFIVFHMIKAFESMYLNYSRGMMQKGTWLGWKTLFTNYLKEPGMAWYWNIRKDVFHPDFQRLVDTLSDPVKIKTTGNNLGTETETINESDSLAIASWVF